MAVKEKSYQYPLLIDQDNLKIKKLAQDNRRSLRAEINAAIEYWIQYQDKLKKPSN